MQISQKKTVQGLVFNIQRYSVHDGGGIRTIIFLKGCPLKCPWCSNPESRKEVQPTTWMKNSREEIVGEWRTVEDLVDEVMKDEIFFRTSGGGVTLSGGEVLMQSEFASELLKEFYSLGIHTAIETTGCFPKERLHSLLPYVDQVLFDLKIMDEKRAKSVIGITSKTVKENFELAFQFPLTEVIPRIPLIPEYTATEENIHSIITYIKDFGIKEVHLLPFHQFGSSKYDYLGWRYLLKETEPLTKEELQRIRTIFKEAQITGNIDGLE